MTPTSKFLLNTFKQIFWAEPHSLDLKMVFVLPSIAKHINVQFMKNAHSCAAITRSGTPNVSANAKSFKWCHPTSLGFHQKIHKILKIYTFRIKLSFPSQVAWHLLQYPTQICLPTCIAHRLCKRFCQTDRSHQVI